LLDLSNNRLRRLNDTTFYGVSELENLYVGGNHLVDVAPRALAYFAKSLTRLDLADNRLQAIDFQALAAAERLTFVDLASNPWTCNCSLRRTSDGGSEALRAAWDLIVCELPPAARGKLLSSVLVGQNSTVEYCDPHLPTTQQPPWSPVDFVHRWWIVTAVLLVLILVLMSSLVATVHRRRSRTWSPCHKVSSVSTV